MTQDPSLSNLLKWSIENSNPTEPTTDTNEQPQQSRPIDPSVLNAIFGGPSDADLMKESMNSILDSSIPLSDRLIAFDNFEQLIESLDNANNMAPLGLWTPLLSQLEHKEPELRKMAAWCVGTAVQNNVQAQERALVGGAVPRLLKLFQENEEMNRRKARYAVSSLVRNYQPGVDALVEELNDGRPGIDASDMEAIDRLLEELLGKV